MARDTFVPGQSRERTAEGNRVRVVDVRTGETGTVPADGVEQALAAGRVRVATSEESHQARRRRQYEGQDFAAAVTGAANTLTFGLVDSDDVQGLREFNEGAFEGGGLAGSLALGGGVASALRGVRAAGALGRVAAGVGEGAVVTAAETGAALSDERVAGDAGLNAEALMASLGGSALLGGALGGAIEGAIMGTGRLGRAAMRRGGRSLASTREAMGTMVQRTTGRDALPGVADLMLDRIGRVGAAGLDEADGAFLRRGLQLSPEGRALREVIDRGDAVIDDALRPLRSQIDDLQQVARRTAEEATGTLKRGQVRRMVSEHALADAGQELAGFSGAVREMSEMLRNAPGATGARAMANRLDNYVAAADDAIARGLENGGREGATDAFIALDQLKRRYGREVQRARRSMNLREVAPELEGVYEVGRQFLEREDLFGGAAVAQREINAAWSEMLSTSRQFRRRFLTDAGEQEGFEQLLTADPRKLRSFLENTGTEVGSLDDEIFEKFLQRQSDFNDAVGRHYDVDPELASAYANSRTTLDSLRHTREGIRQSVAARNQFNALSQGIAERDSILSGALNAQTLGILGGVVAGSDGEGAGAGAAAGVGLGALLSAARRPDRLVRMLASVERMTQSFRGRLGRESKRFVDRVGRTRVRAPNVRGAVVGMTAAQVADRFNTLVGTASQNQDLEGMTERLAERSQDLSEAAPETGAMLVAAATRAQMYLQQQMPPLAFDVPGPLGAPSTDPSQRVSEDEQRALLRVAETIEDPLRVLDAAGRGMLTTEHTETLRTVYPRLHQELVTTVTEEIADRDEPLPYDGRLRVSLLLDVPTDPSLMPDYIAAMQATPTGPQDTGGPLLTPGNRTAPELAGMYETTTQRTRRR